MTNTQKTILVTGGAGFVGSHLCERLQKDGHNVISLDNYFTGSKDNHIEGVDYREGHTKDIAQHIPEDVDLIYHLGEYSRVEQSVLEPDIVHDLNTRGTQGVIDFWKKHRCKLVYAGSSTKFGDAGKSRYTSPYAQTKAENSEQVAKVGKSEQLPYAITYFYNVYGKRERSGVYGTVIEHFKRMYLSGAPCAIVAPGTQERNFTHVHDVVDALLLVADTDTSDEYGLGNKKAYSIAAVAELFGFGKDVVMFPERSGNRMTSLLDTKNIEELGWVASRDLATYIKEFTASHTRGEQREKRVLVFSTTMHPTVGLAEAACIELAKALPDVTFDVVTTYFTRDAHRTPSPLANVHIHRVGFGITFDKFLLPFFGTIKARSLARQHSYLFTWSLMASYAALAGVIFKRVSNQPLLVTLADQNVDDLSSLKRILFSIMLSQADQIYGTHNTQENQLAQAAKRALPKNTLGQGDAFANALRFTYADIVRRKFTEAS